MNRIQTDIKGSYFVEGETEEQISNLIGENISKLHLVIEGLRDFENAIRLRISFYVKDEFFECKIPIKQSVYDDIDFDLWNIIILPAVKETYELRRNDKA